MFRDRIVGSGRMPASQFQANPLNWRTHPDAQRQAVHGSLTELGWIAPVLVNIRTGHLIDGHERVWQALQDGDQEVPYIEVDLSEEEEKLALAVFDPITGMAGADAELLNALLNDVQTSESALQDLLDSLAEEIVEEEEEPYTGKIESPHYLPSDIRPEVGELLDEAKTRHLIERIQAADGLTEEERQFLIAAARRHTVFHFNRIADYYAHASAEMQELMEESALVIIDFNRAIELGYVDLTRRIAEMVEEEYGD